MAVILTCPQGHHWQVPEEGAAREQPPSVCPVCGAASVEPQPPRGLPATLDLPANPRPENGAAQDESLGRSEHGSPLTTPVKFTNAPTLPSAELPIPSPGEGPVHTQHIPGYEILGELGHGGMGVVYKARQLRLQRVVALKMILAGASADGQQLDRFQAEAAAVARLQHPHIVQIYEIGQYNGSPFFSLEYVDGGTLAQKLNGAPQPPRLAAHLVRLLALAMHSAHQRGIIHRDLKPGNILLQTLTDVSSNPDSFCAEEESALDRYGIPKITDFGLAKHLGDIQSQTRTGAVLGTPSYMAPEQAEGRTHAIGPATDVYGLGTILYEMFTGRPPFDTENSLQTIRKLLTTDPVPPSQLHLKVPRDLETICLKCLEKDPRKRYPSAAALAEDLDRYLQNQPILARPIGPLGRSVKWVRRHPTPSALVAVIALALGVVLVGGATYQVRLGHALAEARRQSELNRQNLVRMHVSQGIKAMNEGDDSIALLWFTEALRQDTDVVAQSPDAGAAARPPDRAAQQEEQHRRRIAAVLQSCPKLSQLWIHEGAVNDACFSPDGKRVLTASDDGTARVWDSDTGQSRCGPLQHTSAVRRAVFSNDGRHLATAGDDRTARVWDAVSGRPVTPPLEHPSAVDWVAFSPDGRLVVTAGVDDRARVWEVAGGKQAPEELRQAGTVQQALFSPDGRWLATFATDGTAQLWDAATRQSAGVVFTHAQAIRCLAFSPDSQRLATGSDDRTAAVWDVQTGTQVCPSLRHRDAVLGVAFGPHGLCLATGSADATAAIWRVSDGERLNRSLDHKSAVRHVAFSPDGCQVVTAGDDNVARIWNAATGRPITPPLRYHGNINRATFSPDGRRLLTGSDDGTVRLWDITCGRLRSVPDDAAAFRRQVAHYLPAHTVSLPPAPTGPGDERRRSPDGKWLIDLHGSEARVHNAQTGEPVAPPLKHRQRITYAGFSPDGRFVVTASVDQTARVWEAASGEPVGPPLRHASAVECADFSPDSRRVITASEDNTACLWEVRTGELLVPPLTHHGTVTQALFASDGRRVATASLDRTAKVWDAASGQALTPPLEHPWPVRQIHFTADDQRLLTTGANGVVWSWDLPCSLCLAQNLVQLAQVISGSRIDEKCGLMPVRPDELEGSWRALREASAELFTFSAEDVLAWHRQSADTGARGQYWESALWHLDHLIQGEPNNLLNYARRGLVEAELGRWGPASADFARVVKDDPGETEVWSLDALLRLQRGDEAGYRRACAALVEREKKGDDLSLAYLTAWTCTLAPHSGVSAPEIVVLAQRAESLAPRDPEYLCTLATALLRAGDLEAAARHVNEALAGRGHKASAREWLLLALIRYRLGLTVEAQQWLEKARTQANTDASALSWVQQLQIRLLREETEKLVKGKKPAGE
jgi:WD40 repeat protein/serine/threonine protein kinase/tetratricopeptide (TPR) repeat protein